MLFPAFSAHAQSVGKVPVDVELVLAVDVSYSVDEEEAKRQREGYIAALSDPETISAITAGPDGRIAICYLEWADSNRQQVVVPWTVIAGPDDARKFANALRAAPVHQGRYTAIGNALHKSVALIRDNGFDGARKVIDISGDGPQNQGMNLQMARTQAHNDGIMVNGLAVQPKTQSRWRTPVDVSQYFHDHVITGTGAFVMPVDAHHVFREAIMRKLIREIAFMPHPPHIAPNHKGQIHEVQPAP